ncbi:MAG: hypothetical protein HY924_10940 [Elusimicrobia bacterium]|nr:hypothetical protein [Elusimicrobiota bacterium]
MGSDGQEPRDELVSSGSFRIDRAAAAGKLRERQLAEPREFLRCWVRAAAASGAQLVSVRSSDEGVAVRFAGTPLPPAVLADPLAGLLSEELGEPALQVAYGALAAERLRPSSIKAAVVDGKNVLSAAWDPKGRGTAQDAVERLRRSYGMAFFGLEIDGLAVPDPAAAGPPVWSAGDRFKGIVALEDPRAGSRGRARFYKAGVLIEERVVDLGGAYTAYVADGRFNLDLSQSRVIESKRLRKAMARLRSLKRRLKGRPLSSDTVRSVWLRRAAWVAATAVATSGLGWFALRFILIP